ncbi:MerR family DNA-binding transcriptional regulator [Streptosporangium vulgare]|uniref:MerR family DNA-binding transcriptional regulator n=1 Tax=Streptosporangium vulgare TaxID=46190 RepID=UPI0031D17835
MLEWTPGQVNFREMVGLDLEWVPGEMLPGVSVYTPGQVVEETGFSLDTLRYYERIGLLESISRNAAGQRRFHAGGRRLARHAPLPA